MNSTRAVALVVGLASCSPHSVKHDPMPPVAVPDRWAAATANATELPDRWWQSFGDPKLDRLIAETLAGNLQLRAAWSRVRQARSLVRQAGAAQFPQLDLTAQAARARQRFEITEGMVFTPEVNSFQLSGAAAYEVDLWKRIGNTKAAAALDVLAVRDDAEAVAMSLAAEVAEAYFDIVATKAQQQVLQQQQQINDTFLELTLLRFRQGTATALDVFQQRQQALATRAQIEAADGVLRTSGARLAVLRGGDPADRAWIEEAPAELPDPRVTPAVGVPGDLLVRPDVRAARRRAEAADYRVAVAIADRLPALRIGGSGGFASSRLLDLFDGIIFNIFAQVTQSIFDGGRRAAEVERNRDVVDERLYQLAHALVSAVAEVDQALADETTRRIEIATFGERRKLAGDTLTEAREFYANGQVDYLTVLTALASVQSLELQELGARRALVSARIRLCRALGGSWTNRLAVPARAERK
jgi:outer membrane protein, multidrug efflux system